MGFKPFLAQGAVLINDDCEISRSVFEGGIESVVEHKGTAANPTNAPR